MTSASATSLGQIEPLGWRQGSVVPVSLAQRICDEGYLPDGTDFDPATDYLIVISQDCDLVSLSAKNEPWCEVLIAKAPAKPDGNFFHGKNPRRIQFELNNAGMLECSIHDRFRFPREELIACGPADNVIATDRVLDLLRQWIVKRYVRAAFPGTFNNRYAGIRKHIETALGDEGGMYLVEIFLLINTFDELPADETYNIVLIGSMMDEDFDDSGKSAKAKEALAAVAQLFEECEGIKALNYTVRARRNLSLSELDLLRRWDYLDPISTRAG